MIRPQRLHALAAAVSLTCLAALTACSSDSPGEDDTAQTVTATLLPPIAQPGPDPAPAAEAQVVVEATVEPAGAGRALTLERSAGQKWEDVGSAELSEDGTASFVVDAVDDAGYRVVAEATGDLDAATSDPVDASAVGALDFDEAFDGDDLSSTWVPRGTEYNPEGLRVCSRGSADAAEVGGGTLGLEVVEGPEPDRAVHGEEGERQDPRAVRLPLERTPRDQSPLPLRRDRGADQVPA